MYRYFFSVALVFGAFCAAKKSSQGLSFGFNNNDLVSICGAVLINTEVALTTANCIIVPFFGQNTTIKIEFDTIIESEQMSAVTKVCIHPKYDSDNELQYNIAALIIKKKITDVKIANVVSKIPPSADVQMNGYSTFFLEYDQFKLKMQKAMILSKDACKAMSGVRVGFEDIICLSKQPQDKGAPVYLIQKDPTKDEVLALTYGNIHNTVTLGISLATNSVKEFVEKYVRYFSIFPISKSC